jgi:hypothetical protein
MTRHEGRPSRASTSGSVTYAIKDTDIEGVHITKDLLHGDERQEDRLVRER